MVIIYTDCEQVPTGTAEIDWTDPFGVETPDDWQGVLSGCIPDIYSRQLTDLTSGHHVWKFGVPVYCKAYDVIGVF